MLRDGFISPCSKVITALGAPSRPGSTMSPVSRSDNATWAINLIWGSSLCKDEDPCSKTTAIPSSGEPGTGTVDSCVGLTTGLGWSDRYTNAHCDLLSSYLQPHAYSEDENSPSPLTHRLSSMALSRISSFASLRSQYGHSIPTPVFYAVKCLHRSDTSPSPSRRQLHLHAIGLHMLAFTHPNVVFLHRVVEDDNFTYIVTDYCEDGDLFTQIRRPDDSNTFDSLQALTSSSGSSRASS